MNSAGVLYVIYMIFLIFALIGLVATAGTAGYAGGVGAFIVGVIAFAPPVLFLGWVVFTLKKCSDCLEKSGLLTK